MEPTGSTRRPRPRLTLPIALSVVGVLAAAVRAAALAGTPLLVTNDGAWYLTWAVQLWEGHGVAWPPFRTPGYPLVLAGMFLAAGTGPLPVLLVQHLLGVAAALLIGLLVGRWRRPIHALAWGCVVALDPVLLAYESAALSESLATSLLILVAAAALLPRPGSARAALAGGAVLAVLCLVRPAFQLMAPFLIAGIALEGSDGPRTTLRRAALTTAAFMVPLAPWLIANANRGTYGLSAGNGIYAWIGASQAGLLDPAYPLPPRLREEYDRTAAPEPSSEAGIHEFLGRTNAWADPATRRALAAWAVHSAARRPGSYAAACGRAAAWQLGWFPSPAGPANETRWLMWRLGRPAPPGDGRPVNFQFDQPFPRADAFAMHAPPAGLARWMSRWSRELTPPFHRAPFLVCALAATALAVHARRWRLAGLFAGSILVFAAHAAFLLPNSRYSLPCWILWYAALPATTSLLVAARRSPRNPGQDLGA